jgi:hypothetical protein
MAKYVKLRIFERRQLLWIMQVGPKCDHMYSYKADVQRREAKIVAISYLWVHFPVSVTWR